MENKKYLPRLIDARIDKYLSAFGAVCIEGPKWCGKTWTGEKHAQSAFMLADPADNFANRALVQLDVSKALLGERPHLIDEWQEVPSIWDAVRFAVDKEGESGRFILTGSTTPVDKGVVHSGTGRIASLMMHTMSLYESGHSTGLVSLADVCNGEDIGVQNAGSPSLEDLCSFVICGGWPGALGKSPEVASLIPREYIDNVINIDINKVDDIEWNTSKVRKVLRSLARNEATTVSNATIAGDASEEGEAAVSGNTISAYLNAFKRMFLTNDIEPFSTFLRSPMRVKQTPKRHFCDPSIAAALLSASEKMLMRDLRTFGFLFESLALRDLQIYAETLGARLFHYQDYDGREIDGVVQFDDDTWSAFEVKLNPALVDEAAANLLKISRIFKHKPPTAMAVIVGKSGIAYRREDGVYVLPITVLKP